MPAPPDDPAATLRTVAFGADHGQGPWGVAWFPATGERGILVAGEDERTAAHEVRLTEPEPGSWQVQGDGIELEAVAVSEPAALGGAENAPAGDAQLCQVSGHYADGGRRVGVQAPGRRGQARPVGLERLDSLREVSAWFGDDEAEVVIALRPRKHRGHEQDAVAAAVIDADGGLAIGEPRLSTTYTADGEPMRMNLELWSSDPEQFPRRVAGEAASGAARATTAGWRWEVRRLRCHSRGREGTGVYLLGRRT